MANHTFVFLVDFFAIPRYTHCMGGSLVDGLSLRVVNNDIHLYTTLQHCSNTASTLNISGNIFRRLSLPLASTVEQST